MLIDQIRTDMVVAQKSRDVRLLGVLRLLLSALNYRQIDVGVEKFDQEMQLAVLRTEAKKRQESIDIFSQVGDAARTEQEQYELTIIMGYLPAPIGEEVVRKTIQEVAAETGKTGGPLIGEVVKRLGSGVDGKLVAKLVALL